MRTSMSLKDSYHLNIPWVYVMSSWHQSPRVVISCLTHWWETAWLDVVNFLINTFDIQSYLLRWTIMFVLANIDAYTSYLDHKNFRKARYIDQNMNRHATQANIASWVSSEARRIQELLPILTHADYHVDIHSTTQSPTSMAIYTSRSQHLFQSVLNVDHQYVWIPDHQVWKPLIDICERSWWIGIWLETGMQEDGTAYVTWIDNVLRIITSLEMIDESYIQPYLLNPKPSTIYEIYGSVLITHADTFATSQHFNHWQRICTDTVIAHQWADPIYVTQDSIIILPSDPQKYYSNEEYCFLARG